MELNVKKLGIDNIETTTNNTEKKMRLSEDAQTMVFQLFTKNVYSNPIGTIVREITSNCFDSHVEAGVNSPVIIKKSYDKETESHYISFIDFGVGMSPDRIENVYGVYFESTKRTNNNEIGGFGIGGKTPLAYKRQTGQGETEYDNSFYVITYHNKTKYVYCIYEGTETPVISLLHKEKTEKRNGTEIRVPVLEKDLNTFNVEMLRQLYYFENIIFEGFDNEINNGGLTNDYKIVRAKNFLFRGHGYSNKMHVCLGRVAYPIDFNALDLNEYDYSMPVAIKLNIGDINVTVSRESLDYSEKTIKTLKKKIKETKDELTQMLSKQYQDVVTLEDYFKITETFGELRMSNGSTINLSKYLSKKDINYTKFKFNDIKIPKVNILFSLFFNVKEYGNKSKKWSNNNFTGTYNVVQNQENLFYYEEKFNRKIIKQSYLKDEFNNFYILSKKDFINSIDNYYDKLGAINNLFNLNLNKLVDDNGKPIKIVQKILNLQEDLFEIIKKYRTNYDTIVVPKDFIESRKKNKMSVEIKNKFIPVGFNGNSKKIKVKVGDFYESNARIFYGTKNDEVKLINAQQVFEILFNKKYVVGRYNSYSNKFQNFHSSSSDHHGIMFITIAQNNIKYIKNFKNIHHINEFKSRMLRRKEEYVNDIYNISKVIGKYNMFIDPLFKLESFSLINSNLGNLIKEINTEINKYNDEKISGFINKINLIEHYFNLSNVHPDVNSTILDKKIDKLISIQEKNEDILRYINVSTYNINNLKEYPSLHKILKKVMKFK